MWNSFNVWIQVLLFYFLIIWIFCMCDNMFNFLQETEERPSLNSSCIVCYDPAFILEFSLHALAVKYIDPMDFSRLGLLGLAFASLSSPNESMRKLAYAVLGRYTQNLEVRLFCLIYISSLQASFLDRVYQIYKTSGFPGCWMVILCTVWIECLSMLDEHLLMQDISFMTWEFCSQLTQETLAKFCSWIWASTFYLFLE